MLITALEMSHASPANHKLQLTSKQDLTNCCEVENFQTESVLCTTFSFVDADNSAWFGQVSGVRKYDMTVEDVNRNLRRNTDETIYPDWTAGLTLVADDDNDSVSTSSDPSSFALIM